MVDHGRLKTHFIKGTLSKLIITRRLRSAGGGAWQIWIGLKYKAKIQRQTGMNDIFHFVQA
jgi:hypothetical protein